MVFTSFVTTKGTRFSLDGRPLFVNGFNAYFLMALSVDSFSRPRAVSLLEEASSVGLNVCRTWAFNDGNGYEALQTSPGIYDERVFQAVLTRVNTITGIMYRDDPTILSWELMNEPRCISDQSGNLLQAWIEEMAQYVKSIDSNHLLEVGLEGFYGPPSLARMDKNPNSYCQQLGTDFIRNHQVMGIDYASMHAYPDAWLGWNVSIDDRISFMETWIDAHASDCKSSRLQMPVLLAEVGLSQWSGGFSVENRDRLLRATYGAILSSVATGGAAAGALIWQLFPSGIDDWSDGYQILLSRDTTTADVIIQQCQQIASLNDQSNISSKL